MKKVLFIIQSYPSNRSANVLCDEKIMNTMRLTGQYDIHCLCYRFYGQPLYEELNGFKIHRVKRAKWWDLYTYARDRENDSLLCRIVVKLNRLYMRVRQVCCIPLYPNYEPLLARKMGSSAVRLQKHEAFDLVVAEHSGRDTLYAGQQLKKIFSAVKFIAILWDPLSGRDLAKYLPRSYAKHRVSKDEIILLNNADIIISLKSNEQYQVAHNSNKLFFRKIKFLDIPGIELRDIPYSQNSFIKQNKINILYSGILSYPDRDPSILIKLLNESEYAPHIHLMFFCAGSAVPLAQKELKSFKGSYIIHPYIPKLSLDSIANQANILINIGGINSRMVPSKIFEYMSLGKPIISTMQIDDDSSKPYLDKYPLSLIIDIRKNLQQSVREVDKFIKANSNSSIDYQVVKNLFPLNTPQAFLKVIEEIL